MDTIIIYICIFICMTYGFLEGYPLSLNYNNMCSRIMFSLLSGSLKTLSTLIIILLYIYKCPLIISISIGFWISQVFRIYIITFTYPNNVSILDANSILLYYLLGTFGYKFWRNVVISIIFLSIAVEYLLVA